MRLKILSSFQVADPKLKPQVSQTLKSMHDLLPSMRQDPSKPKTITVQIYGRRKTDCNQKPVSRLLYSFITYINELIIVKGRAGMR
jgi:hypothetical protein